MRINLNPDETFANRPPIGSRWKSLNGGEEIIAASWSGGVVFENTQRTVTAFELVHHYQPYCNQCATYHEPECPHELTEQFASHISEQHNRPATHEDTYSHCIGLMRACAEAADDSQEAA